MICVEGALPGVWLVTPELRVHSAGGRWDDPAFGISWPDPNPIISEGDQCDPDSTA